MNRMTEYRKRAGLKQQNVADALKIDQSTVAKWESGVALPRADKLIKLARMYGCLVNELLEDEDGAANDDGADAEK